MTAEGPGFRVQGVAMRGYAAGRVALIEWVVLAGLSGFAWAEPSFVETGRLAAARAEWLALDGDRLAVGRAHGVELVLAAPRPERRGWIERAVPTSSGVIAGNLLFLAGPGGRVERRWLDRPEERGRTLDLDPEIADEILLGRAVDHLVVIEQGRTVRLYEIVVHAHHGAAHREVGDLVAAGVLPFADRSVAVASSGATVYVALERGRVAVIDASDPLRPTLVGELDTGIEIRALAAAGHRLFVLDGQSLRVFDVEGENAMLAHQSDLPGARAIEVAGRSVYVATDDGLIALRDTSAGEATFSVTVGNNFFNPQTVTVDPGDTVTWNKPVTAVGHNVEACDGAPDPAVCAGAVATETFRSGNVTTSAFSFSVTFDLPGQNPYFCALHAAGGMSGRITVNDLSPAAPPGVPAGPPGMPMTVAKVDTGGNSLTLTYDVSSCEGAADHHIVVGGGSTLPAALGGALGLHGATCNIGTTSPFVWGSPPTTIDPTGLVWWLVVADDNATVEGSWGLNGAGNERIGPGAGGSSGLCSIAAKDLTNTCGQ